MKSHFSTTNVARDTILCNWHKFLDNGCPDEDITGLYFAKNQLTEPNSKPQNWSSRVSKLVGILPIRPHHAIAAAKYKMNQGRRNVYERHTF